MRVLEGPRGDYRALTTDVELVGKSSSEPPFEPSWRRGAQGSGEYFLEGTPYAVMWAPPAGDGEPGVYDPDRWAVVLGDENLSWHETMREAREEAERIVRRTMEGREEFRQPKNPEFERKVRRAKGGRFGAKAAAVAIAAATASGASAQVGVSPSTIQGKAEVTYYRLWERVASYFGGASAPAVGMGEGNATTTIFAESGEPRVLIPPSVMKLLAGKGKRRNQQAALESVLHEFAHAHQSDAIKASPEEREAGAMLFAYYAAKTLWPKREVDSPLGNDYVQAFVEKYGPNGWLTQFA
jgi:hypothetical protein